MANVSSISRRGAHAMARAWRTQMRDRDEAGPTFAQLFFSLLPEEQARSQLAPAVTALLKAAEQRLAKRAACPPGWHRRDENLIAEVMARFGYRARRRSRT
jgi:hypothetical protein